MSRHLPPFHEANAEDHTAAQAVAFHSEQGWNLLSNGVVVCDDTGDPSSDGYGTPPHPMHWLSALG